MENGLIFFPNCIFFQKVYSKKNMFKTVPITVKSDDATPTKQGND